MKKTDMVWSKFCFSLSGYLQACFSLSGYLLAAWLAQVKLGSFHLETVPLLKGKFLQAYEFDKYCGKKI